MIVVYAGLVMSCVVLLVLLQRVHCRSKIWLSGFMAFLAAYLGLIVLDAQSFRIAPGLYFLLLSILYVPGPLLLGYISHISTRRLVGAKDFLLCALPSVMVLCCLPWLGEGRVLRFSNVAAYQSELYIALFNLLALMAGLQMLCYCLLSIRLLWRMREDWASYQSRTLPRSWYKVLRVLCVILATAVLQVISAWLHPEGNHLSLGDLSFVGLVMYFIALAFSTTRDQPEEIIQSSLPAELETSASVEHMHAEATQVQELVQNQQWYLEEDLSLSRLAEYVELTPHKLSQLLNEVLGLKFYDFINELRLAHAARLLREQPEQSITTIYFSSGFTTKSTFYTGFKKRYDCTPSQYRKLGEE